MEREGEARFRNGRFDLLARSAGAVLQLPLAARLQAEVPAALGAGLPRLPGVASLPRISLAIVRAHLPGLGLREVRDLLAEAARSGVRRGQGRPGADAASGD
ncbi:MAG: hypothetical protein U0841_12680 [Chloroflexia bacterium]